jgi:hypothetical protein
VVPKTVWYLQPSRLALTHSIVTRRNCTSAAVAAAVVRLLRYRCLCLTRSASTCFRSSGLELLDAAPIVVVVDTPTTQTSRNSSNFRMGSAAEAFRLDTPFAEAMTRNE